jgi:ribosome maturation factor RimP
VVIKTRNPVKGNRVVHGVLKGLSEDVVTLDTGGQTIGIAYGNISKARLDG